MERDGANAPSLSTVFFYEFRHLSGNLIVRKDGPAEAENSKDYAHSAHTNKPHKKSPHYKD
ncbi:hypothetical protein UP17_24615 [Peribacillus simplex]|nr:hypothetical protein UP17_24615 [Peribacillus simplex]